MKYSIEYSSDVKRVIKKWKKSNPLLFKKLYDILPELEEHPRIGVGHPEPLIGGKDITWSRHLSAHDRIIYDIYDDVVTVLVIQVGGHYSDE